MDNTLTGLVVVVGNISRMDQETSASRIARFSRRELALLGTKFPSDSMPVA
jgi:hypothetical protein